MSLELESNKLFLLYIFIIIQKTSWNETSIINAFYVFIYYQMLILGLLHLHVYTILFRIRLLIYIWNSKIETSLYTTSMLRQETTKHHILLQYLHHCLHTHTHRSEISNFQARSWLTYF